MSALQRLQEKIAREGLHRLVATRLQQEGFKVAEFADFPTAVRVFGERLFQKNAQYRRILEGLESLRKLEK